jgi:hypothetical protein
MKTKHFFNAVVAALIAVIFFALAGCATNGGASAAPTAADLVRALGGKAKVEGGAVILTEYVRLENAALTVPEGVTLDLAERGPRTTGRRGLDRERRGERHGPRRPRQGLG